VALLVAGLSFYESLLTTFGTMPTGGFHSRNLSIGAYNNVYIESIIIFFMFMVGINFKLYYLAFWKRGIRRVFSDPEFRVYLSLLAVATVLITLDLMMNMRYPVGQAFRFAVFHSVSIQTTTGFATADFSVWPNFSRSILLILMIIGASACSTGGALKVVRIMVLAKYVYRQILLFFNPRIVRPIKVAGRALGEGVVSDIVGLSVLYFSALLLGFIIMSALGLDTVEALSSVIATLGNVGPGLGSIGPAANYSLLPAIGKLVLILCMLIGRLELWTVMAIMTPVFWRTK
jgi:trk system potassium uptake protein TrkH